MNEMPLVSVLIPCYNHEAFLEDCLNSILRQTYGNIELLICDDCSPDSSWDVIRAFAPKLQARFARVELLKNEVNQGVTKNVNRMLALARGEFVKTLASDDAMASTAIEQMVAFLQENPQYGVVVANGIKVPEQQHYPDFSGEAIYGQAPDFSKEGFFLRTARCNPISAPAAMVRMSVYETYGVYDETVKVEDYEFWLRLLKDASVEFGYLDSKLLYYRINAGSMTSMQNNDRLAQRRKVFHTSEMGTLNKYRDYFAPADYSLLVLERILTERQLAVSSGLFAWDNELCLAWKRFDGWDALSVSQQARLRLQGMKQTVKRLLRGG